MERHIPDGIRMPNRRARRPIRASVSAGREARSLDSFNHLQTSEKTTPETFAEWLTRQTDQRDKRRKLVSIQHRLLTSLQVGASNYDFVRQKAAVEGAIGNELSWQTALATLDRSKWKPWKDFKRISECQTLWKGYKASCCEGRAVAVPIGCNHRLCPLCSAHRAEHYRARIRSLFEVVANPWLLTLTVPNPKTLSRATFTALRKRLRAFLKAHKGILMGGVYSIECTWNRDEKSWHPHVHMLVDMAGDPGRLAYADFCALKWRLEFDWFLLTQGGARPGKRTWLKGDFQEWLSGVDSKRTGIDPKWGRARKMIGPFGGGQFDRVGQRRSIDLRACSTDKKAAYEVLKYITKAAAFVGDHHAVAEFLAAVKGVRAIQSFGSCYGFKFDEPKLESTLQCGCGANKFETIGILGLGMVKQSPDGKWYVRDDAPIHGRQRCRGTTHTHGNGVGHGS